MAIMGHNNNNNNNKQIYFLHKKRQQIQYKQQNGRGDPSKPTGPMQHMTKSRAKLWDGSFLEAPMSQKTSKYPKEQATYEYVKTSVKIQ